MHDPIRGATGFVGGRLVPALLAEGHDVSVLVRDGAGYDPPGDVTVHEGDLLDSGSFEAALKGESLSEHLRSRREVESVLASGDYELTTLRAAIVIGDGSANFEMVRQLSGRLPVMITPRWVQNECQPIGIDDVIAYLTGVLDAPETAGGTYEIGGPDVLDRPVLLSALVGHTIAVLVVTAVSVWLLPARENRAGTDS